MLIDTGKSIRRAMGYKECTSIELSRKMNISRQSVYLWRKSTDMSVNKLAEIANCIDIDFNKMLSMGIDDV